MISSGVKIALSAVAIAAIIAAIITAAVLIVPSETNNTYSITYNLYGGINSPANPDSYTTDVVVEFKTPTRDGYIFDGWFTESFYSNQIWDTEGKAKDLLLYAKWHEKQVYTITYELNGGINSPNNPETYLEDSSVLLSHPTKLNCVFYGWHYKEDFSDDRVDYIARHTDKDVTLYARWGVDRTGYTLHYDNSGTYQTPVDWTEIDITGTTDFKYLTYRYEKGYYVKCAENNSISTATTTSWSIDRDLSKWVLIGHTTIVFEGDEKECDIYHVTLDNGEEWTEYICETDGIPYMMSMYRPATEENDNIMVNMIYTYTGRTYTPSSSNYTITIYNDEGIVTEGAGEYRQYAELTLAASADKGYTFGGWYSTEGVCSSTSDELYIELLAEDITLYALNTNEYDEEFYSDVYLEPYVSLRNITWTYYEDSEYKTLEGNTFEHSFSKAGDYIITYIGNRDDGSLYYGMYRIICKGDIERIFTWEYDSMKYTMNLKINYNDYIEKRYDDTPRYRTYTYIAGKLTFDDEHTKKFVVVDKYIDTIALWFKGMKSLQGWTDIQTANCILCFVHSIEYKSDFQTKGKLEYWKYPIETLYEQQGDCEDTSFLYCSIAKAMNYSTALLLFQGHMASSINVIGVTGVPFIYTKDVLTLEFYYCETTPGQWKVCDVPEGYTQDGSHYNYYIKGTIVGAVIPI